MNTLLENPLGAMVIFFQAKKTLLAKTKGIIPHP